MCVKRGGPCRSEAIDGGARTDRYPRARSAKKPLNRSPPLPLKGGVDYRGVDEVLPALLAVQVLRAYLGAYSITPKYANSQLLRVYFACSFAIALENDFTSFRTCKIIHTTYDRVVWVRFRIPPLGRLVRCDNIALS